MRQRRSHAAEAATLALSLAATALAAGGMSPAFAVPRHPCASGAHDPLAAPASGETVSRFGFRRDPVTGKTTWHPGIDYRVEPGAPLRAAGLGRVSKVGGEAPGDLFIVVNYGRGIEVLYAHLDRIDHVVGRCVLRGDILGEAGRQNPVEGGQILHIEVRRNGLPVDPSGILQPYRPFYEPLK